MMRFKKFLSSILVISLINFNNVYAMPGRDPALNALEERTKAGWDKVKFLQKRILEVTDAKLTDRVPTSLSKDMAEISGPFMERYVITQDMARTILSIDEVGDVLRENDKGTSPVKGLGGVFFKTDGRHFNPQKPMLSPALENAAYWFYYIMFGEGATPTSLITVNNVLIKRAPFSLFDKFPDLYKKYNMERFNRKGYASFFEKSIREGISKAALDQFKNSFENSYESFIIQASLGVGSEGLDEFIKRMNKSPQIFNELNQKNISIHFLSSLLINLSDAKGDNFRVENGSIIGIDNDRFFAPDIFRCCPHTQGEHEHGEKCEESVHKVGVRSIFYCWKDILTMSLDNETKYIISSLNPLIPISEWLYQLQLYDQEFIKLKEKKLLGKEWFETPNEESVSEDTKYMVKMNLSAISPLFPLFLTERAINPMLNRLYKLYELLKFSRNINHSKILEYLQPHVAEYYNRIIEQNPQLNCYDVLGRVYEKYGSGYQELGLPQYLADTFMKDIKAPSTGVPLTKVLETIIQNVSLEKYLLKDQAVIVNTIGKLSTVINIQKEIFDKSWLTPQFHLILAEQGLSKEGLKLLISLGHLIDQTDYQNQGLVHKAVLSAKVDLDNAQDLLVFLKEIGANLDLKAIARNENAGTPLTQAMRLPEDYAIPMFNKLIELGAGLETNYPIAERFINAHEDKFKQNKIFKKRVETLLRRDPKLHWNLSLNKLLPIVGETQEEGVIIKTSNSQERFLSSELEGSMLDHKGNIVNQTIYGRRNVASIKSPDGMYGIYFKSFPELPGVEEQVGRLTRNLLGYGAPHTELVRYKDMPVLLSQAIMGENFQDALSNNPDILNQLDHKSLSGMIIMSILVNPEDGKPDNFIVEPIPGNTKKYRLVCVDNDHAFVQSVAKEQRTSWFGWHDVIQVRSVLYCLDQMNERIHQDVRDLFIKLDPANVLKRWLDELKNVHEIYGMLFNENEMKNYFNKNESFLVVPFKENIVPELYQKFLRLKDALEGNDNITHLELLMKMEPLLGKRYLQVLSKSIPVKERFEEVDGVFYSKAMSGVHGTVTTSKQILNSMNIPNKVTVIDELRKGKGYGVDQAIKQLKEAEEHQIKKALYLQKIQSGNLEELSIAKNSQLLEEALEKTDFSKIGSNNEQALIKFLKSLPNKLEHIRKLNLKGSGIILNEELTNNVLGIGNITYLDISGCISLSQNIFAQISDECPGLRILLAAGIGNKANPIRKILYTEVTKQSQGLFRSYIEIITEKDINYPYLERLNISDLPLLVHVRINAPKLKIFEANNCGKFNFIKSDLLNIQTLERVELSNNNLIQEEEIIDLLINRPKIKYYTVEGCANIQNSSKYKDRKTLYNSIFEELRINKNDKELKLERKGLTIIQVIAITSLTNLTSLNLEWNQIRDEGAKALSSLTNLTSLDLRSNQIGDEGAKALSSLTNLTSLSMSENKIGDEGAKSLSSLSNLTTLKLWNNQIEDEGAKSVSSITNLTELYISSNKIGDSGTKSLVYLTNLTTLHVSSNQIGDEGAKSLISLTNLTFLDLSYNQIGDEMMKKLGSMVKRNRAKAPSKEDKKTSEEGKNSRAFPNKKSIQDICDITYQNIPLTLKYLENHSFEINQDEFDKISITKDLAIKLIQNNIKLQNVGGRQLQTLLNYYIQANQELVNIVRKINPSYTRSRNMPFFIANSELNMFSNPSLWLNQYDEEKNQEFQSKIRQMKDVTDLLNNYLDKNHHACKSILLNTLTHFNKAIYNEDGTLDTNLLSIYSKVTDKPLFIWQQISHHIMEKYMQPQLELVCQIPQGYIDPTSGNHFLYFEADGSLLPYIATPPYYSRWFT